MKNMPRPTRSKALQEPARGHPGAYESLDIFGSVFRKNMQETVFSFFLNIVSTLKLMLGPVDAPCMKLFEAWFKIENSGNNIWDMVNP